MRTAILLLASILAASALGAETADGAGTYGAAGRRDPFLPLVGLRPDEPPRGVRDVPWQELRLVGILQGPAGAPVAVFFGGPLAESYFLRPGDRLRDGVLHRIEPRAGKVVIAAEGSPLGHGPRYVEVLLRPPEETPGG